ncbi:MAG: universal stress protein [Reichenbachiella sp.]|uniref:universal stress protein n=1 Tax=Reichenbachiella sp. TaxID=2184521 RepID=UPI003264D607
MISFKKILIPFDDRQVSKGALEYAAMFASSTGASITALFLANPEDYKSKEEFDAELKKMVEQKMKPMLQEVRLTYPKLSKVDLQVRGLTQPLYRHILDFAKNDQIDFIVMRSHGQTLAEDWEDKLNDTNAYKIVLESKCPVFTFTSIPKAPKINSILLPLDLTNGSRYKVPLVIEIAKQFGSTIKLLSSSENLDEHYDLQQLMSETFNDLKKKELNVTAGPIEKLPIADAIVRRTAQGDVDLVAIMSRPGFRWSELWVSPKAKQILAQAKVPVLNIRSSKKLTIDY